MEVLNPNFPDGLEKRMHEDTRNVIDHYKYWSDDEIKADLATRRHPFVILLENFAHDFNISTAVRNSNAFLASEVWICGRRKWDRRGAVGVQNYENINHSLDSTQVIESFKERGYEIVALDNVPSAAPLSEHTWQEKSLMIFGQESIGISNTALNAADKIVYVPQFGSTRSINVGTISGIAMYDYTTRALAK